MDTVKKKPVSTVSLIALLKIRKIYIVNCIFIILRKLSNHITFIRFDYLIYKLGI